MGSVIKFRTTLANKGASFNAVYNKIFSRCTAAQYCTGDRYMNTKHHHKNVIPKYSMMSALIPRNNSNNLCGIYLQKRYLFQGTLSSIDLPPVWLSIKLLDAVHTYTGLPWYLTIAITTISLRAVLLVPFIYLRRSAIKRNIIGERLAKQLMVEVKWAANDRGWTKEMALYQFKVNMKRLVRIENKKEKVEWWRSGLVIGAQVSLWISMSLGLRNMSGLYSDVMYPDLGSEGFVWIPNLLLPDTTWIFPFINGASQYAVFAMHRPLNKQVPLWFKAVNYCIPCVIVFMIPVAASLPSSICWYWTCSSLFGLAQNIAIQSPKVQHILGISETSLQSQSPKTQTNTKEKQ